MQLMIKICILSGAVRLSLILKYTISEPAEGLKIRGVGGQRCGHYLTHPPPLVGIGLTDLPKYEGQMFPCPPSRSDDPEYQHYTFVVDVQK